MTTRLAAFLIMIVQAWSCSTCNAEPSKLTQADLQAFTEKAIADGTVEIDPPTFNPVRYEDGKTQLSVFMGNCSPWKFTKDDLLNRAVQDQFTVTMIRRFRRTPTMRATWAPTLAIVEEKIQQMLVVVAASESQQQKNAEIDYLDSEIDNIYRQHLVRIANQMGLDDLGYKTRVAHAGSNYIVDFEVSPQGIVSYMPDGPWQLYVFATQVKKRTNVPFPNWETPPNTRTELAGKYWFKVYFTESGKDVVMTPGPITIDRAVKLRMSPKGWKQ